MTVDLFINTSDRRQLTKQLTPVVSLSGALRDSTSILNPVILIEGDSSVLSSCNYMYIPSFNRYYFITEIVSVRMGFTYVTGSVDVLTSWAQEIRANTGIIRRQENVWNLYLNDGSLKIYQDGAVLTRPFPSGFTTQELVLAVAGS